MQTKAWHYTFEILRVRGFVEGELAHLCWNCFKRAIKDASMDTSILKLTILSNFGHGSFTNGDKTFLRREYLANFIQHHASEDFLTSLAEDLASDRGISGLTPDEASGILEGFMESKTIGTRGKFVWALALSELRYRFDPSTESGNSAPYNTNQVLY